MTTFSELNSVEKPVTQWLTQMGWNHQSHHDLKIYNRSLTNPIILEILIQKVAEINQISPDNASKIIELLTQNLDNPSPILGNQKFLERLIKGVTYTLNGIDKTYYFIDFDNIWQNSLIVTNQYWVKGEKLIKTDIVLLINGIPLIPIEAKQYAKKGTNWLEGVRQLSTYQQRCDRYFICHGFAVACNGRIAKYGIPGASSSYFNEWKNTSLDTSQENPILDPNNQLCTTYFNEEDGFYHFEVERLPNGKVLETMKLGIIGLLQPARVLDILKNFLVFEKSDGKIIKKIARYQQLQAANKIVKRITETELNQGVIWHTQGSGKSLTMLYTAYKLRNTESLQDPTIYIVVDRKELREQLGGTFDDCEFPNARKVHNINDLKAIIKNSPAGVFITTIQKFRDLGHHQDLRNNIIILIDEAHRTQYGDFQIELKNALPNAKRFAFTGTPIPKTHQEFGTKTEGDRYEHYLDSYSIQTAIEDGATVPIRYTFGPQEWFLDKDNLKQGYAEITADLNEEEKQAVEKRVQAWKVFLKNPERIQILAKDIAIDFKAMVEPQGYKSQIVACDKEACVFYYNELLKYFDPSEITIIFSSGNYEDSEKYELFKSHYKEDKERRQLVANFKRRLTPTEIQNGNNLKILIVCNMLLTGFDAPIEQTMYLDSPLRDHNLLQAVARTNRTYDDKITGLSKQFGRIVDYIGIFENYKEALNYDPEDIGEFEDVDSLIGQFPTVLNKALAPFSHITLEDTPECGLDIVRQLNDLDHGKFEQNFKEVLQLWEALSPHAKLINYQTDYRWLLEIYEIYLEEFKRLDFDAEIYAAKTRQLIQESLTLIEFRGHLPEITIDSDYLDQLRTTKLNTSDKAEKIIRDIETIIRLNEGNSPIYIEFQNRLENLIKKKKAESEAIEKILLQLEILYTELDEIANLPQKMGFTDLGTFEMFTHLKNSLGDNFSENLAKEFVQEIYEKVISPNIYIGWQDIPATIKNLRNDILLYSLSDHYQSLDLDNHEELLDQMMQTILKNYRLN